MAVEAAVTWLGHATFLITTPGGKRIVIDPFIESSPTCPPEFHDLSDIDLILCTHGHNDHIQDAPALAKRNGQPPVVAEPELCELLTSQGVENCAEMGKGGTQMFGDIAVTMVPAIHSSSFEGSDGSTYTGTAGGFVVRLENGYTIYHAGDTCVFGDMRIIGELYHPDLAMLPIGGHYTMDPQQAAYAIELLHVKHVLGMHYGTFPPLTGRPDHVRRIVADSEVTVHELSPGGTLPLPVPVHA